MAAREGFLVLYPEQDRVANAQGCWNWFDTDTGRAFAEVELIVQAIDPVCAAHGVDPRRVAIAGLSAGASTAALLAMRHPDRVCAVIMHSGVPPGTARSSLTALAAMRGRRSTVAPRIGSPIGSAIAPHAEPRRPGEAEAAFALPPLLVIHGGANRTVSPRNGQAAARTWAQAMGAEPAALRTVIRGARYPMQITDYKVGPRVVAQHVAIPGLGHAWSGGTAGEPFSDPQGPDASRMVWSFVSKRLGVVAPAVPGR